MQCYLSVLYVPQVIFLSLYGDVWQWCAWCLLLLSAGFRVFFVDVCVTYSNDDSSRFSVYLVSD